MKKYVVTGGAGFIGSALVRGLIAHGDGEVHVIDNLLTGSKQNLKEIWSRIELHIADIRNYEEITTRFYRSFATRTWCFTSPPFLRCPGRFMIPCRHMK